MKVVSKILEKDVKSGSFIVESINYTNKEKSSFSLPEKEAPYLMIGDTLLDLFFDSTDGKKLRKCHCLPIKEFPIKEFPIKEFPTKESVEKEIKSIENKILAGLYHFGLV